MNNLPQVVKEFAPHGTLRAALNFGNTVLVQRGSSGEPRGIAPALANELARRLGIGVEFVPFEAAGQVFEALARQAWDVAFLAIDPKRAAEIAFTAPYVLIEGTYVVPGDSALRSVEDVDRDNVRVAVGQGSAYDLYLSRNLKHASLVRYQGGATTRAAFVAEQLEALAGIKQQMLEFVAAHPQYRLVPGRFMVIEQAMGVPKGRHLAARYLHDFVEEMKSSGFVTRALRANGQTDAEVAPAA
jgi:polar amino acid transport system substrate-binding protein